MLFIKKNIIWLVCILSFFTALFYNQLNLNKLPQNQIRDNTTVITKDDYSYLNPAETYIKTGWWKQEGNSMQSHFLRPPGYGAFYWIFLNLSPNPLWHLKIAQLLLFAFSTYWFYNILSVVSKNNITNLITTTLFGLSPFLTGFLSYTLTEGITPALTLLYVFLLVKASKKEDARKKNLFYLFSAICFSILLIVRPPLGFLGLLLPIFILRDYWSAGIAKKGFKLFFLGSIAFSLMAAWQIRNYKLTGSYVGMHAIYYPDNNSLYRPTFKEYWNFVGGWAQEGAEAHSYMVPMWKAAIKGDTSQFYIDNAIATFPQKVVDHFGEDRLIAVFRKYQEATLLQKVFYDKNLPMPRTTPIIEQESIEAFKAITAEFRDTFWIDAHILSPLKVFRTMSFHSNLSMHIFQHTYRGNWLVEAIRLLFYGIHALCFLTLIASFLYSHKIDWQMAGINIAVFCYLFYLCYFQRGIEERYTLPILALLLINLATTISFLIEKFPSRRNS